MADRSGKPLGVRVLVLGQQPPLDMLGAKSVVAQIRTFHPTFPKVAAAQNVALVAAPSDKNGQGFQTLAQPCWGDVVQAEGTVLTEPGTAALIQTADCPVTVLVNARTGVVIPIHCGRNALEPTGTCQCYTVLTPAKKLLLAEPSDAEHIYAYITPSIGAARFVHEGPDDEHYIAPFRQLFTEAIVDEARRALDLRQVIITIITDWWGVPTDNISDSGICTFETMGLASYQRNPESPKRNSVIMVKH